MQTIDLDGPDGEAMAMMAPPAQRVSVQLGKDPEPIIADMMSGSYEHLCDVFENNFNEYFELVGGGQDANNE